MKTASWRGGACAAMAALVPLLAGCPKQRSTMDRPPEVNPPPALERSAEARSEELGDLARRFASTAQRLPGRTADEHRAGVQQVFSDLSQILPILFGPNPEGSQRQQLRVVESARTQLAAAPQGLAPEPTIDTGLRAAYDALSALARNRYFEQANLGSTVDRLGVTVARLDTSRGVPHQQTVADVVDLMSEVVNGMARAMDDRLEAQQQVKSQDNAKPRKDAPKPDQEAPQPEDKARETDSPEPGRKEPESPATEPEPGETPEPKDEPGGQDAEGGR